ncbi:MAG: DHH family phosphoesterase [Bacteroidetes bacterium]|nr:DHH family phosphoesterase [Bacteroidota bacterium]MCH8523946.1 DHHA1 domain-containing protein [Balneolales bacterium]
MSETRPETQHLIKALKSYKNKKVAVISHVRPDADCIGSQVALCRWLGKHKVTAFAFNDDTLPPSINWLGDHYPIKQTAMNKMAECDAIVFVDGNHPSRFGLAGEFAERSNKPLYMIDHHPGPAEKLFKDFVSVITASSTCELVYELYASEDLEHLDLASAEALYAGITTDTGSFRFDSVTASTHEAVARMIRKVNLKTEPIHRKIYDGKTVNQLHLMAKVLETVETHHGNRIASLRVPADFLRETKTSYHDLEGFVSYALAIRGVMAAVIFTEMDNKIKLSLRSNSDEINVNTWARAFNGGGHAKAAGGFHEGPLEKAVQEVLAFGARQLH